MKGFPKASFKSFKTEKEAIAFVESSRQGKNATKKRECQVNGPDSEIVTKRQRVFDKVIKVHIMFDGGSRGNPGISGSGTLVTITDVSGNRTTHIRKYIGENFTNNEAEYQGIICGLQFLKREVLALCQSPLSLQIGLIVQGDSDLIIKQLNGTYQCRNNRLRIRYKNVMDLLEELKQYGECQVLFEHVYRRDNSVADGKARINNLNFVQYIH